jgi:hypothetical protein
MFNVHISMAPSLRAKLEERVEALLQRGIAITVDALVGRYVFCTARHTLLSDGGLSNADIAQAARPALRSLEHAGYALVISTWTVEEPAPDDAMLAIRQQLGLLLPSDVPVKYREHYVHLPDGPEHVVLRQTAPAVLFHVHRSGILHKPICSVRGCEDQMPDLLRAAQQWFTMNGSLRHVA